MPRMKNVTVVFTDTTARIFVNREPDIVGTRVVNPDLSAVSRTPPHFWKLDGTRVVGMTRSERLARMRRLRSRGEAPRRRLPRPWLALISAGVGALVAEGAHQLFLLLWP